MSDLKPLWTPDADQIAQSNLAKFMALAEGQSGKRFQGYDDFHAWTIEDREGFWSLLWDEAKIIGEKGSVILGKDVMPGAEFFPEARLNFAENLLRKKDDSDAIVFQGEDKKSYRLTWNGLHDLVSRMQQALAAAGVGEGDRVAAMLPNLPEAVAAMLATASIGAIWSSCSPDFGEKGVLDRFGQIEPKVFFCCDGYWYNGKDIEIADKLDVIVNGLETASTVVIVDYMGRSDAVAARLDRAISLGGFIADFPAQAVTFKRLPFDHPLYILFSSGTTGIPKCIVHCAGGILLQHVKEHALVCGLRDGDKVFYFTTLGWMMWNWLVSGLSVGATLILYDGSPFAPDEGVIFDYAAREKMTMLGTSAKFIDAVKKSGLKPKDHYDLSSLRIIGSTGSPLAPESFEFVYSDVKQDVHLASMSGGTDLCACFVGGVGMKPVYVGELQGPMPGMAVDVFNDDGESVVEEKGELVCTRAFPSMPIKFWNDPDGMKYHGAYFERFDGIWWHGDFAEWTARGGMVIHGRSDATLNPGGVRIGTAEIYNQVEKMDEVVEGLAIGQSWDNDTRIILFVRLHEGVELDDALVKSIKQKIRVGASPRHVPAKVIQVADIPRTKSGKITELAVRDIIHGRSVKNKEALANAEALDLYTNLPDLSEA